MRYFTSSGFHIAMLPRGLRLVLTLYLLANLFGVLVSAMKFMQRMDPTPASVVKYYQGEDAGAKEPDVDPFLPGEGGGKSVRYITDTTHPHLFTVPLVLLVICHLAHLTRISQLFLGLLDLGAFVGFLLMFGAPWVLPAAPGLFAGTMIAGGVLLTTTMALLCLIPLCAMWWPRSVARPRLHGRGEHGGDEHGRG